MPCPPEKTSYLSTYIINNMILHRYVLFTFLAFSITILKAQELPVAEVTFDFNDHVFKEKNDKLKMKAIGASLSNDRFGNKESAVHLDGNLYSYLNLGTSTILKPKKGTISIWVTIDRDVRTGRGSPSNPIIVTKNSENRGWYNAYYVGYELATNRIGAVSSIDSVSSEAIAFGKDSLIFNKWYHIAITFNNDSLWLYIDGELQNRSFKGFETFYLPSDSVVIGHGASKVNERFTQGCFDDIQFFHRVLKPNEIKDLYNAPNPNAFQRKLTEAFKYGLIVLLITLTIIFILYRNKQKLKKQKERLELDNKIAQLEMQVVKTQMNPHFISNCLAAIQGLIYDGSVEKAGQYIAKFSLFMRRVLNYSDKTFISLEEELELVKLNVELEQLRFRDKFEFTLSIDKDVDVFEVMMPSLITQPIIENAIWHGLLPLKDKRKPTLKMYVYQKEESLYIEIEDNGVGRDPVLVDKRNSKGTRLIKDRLESLSRLSGSSNYKMEIVDLKNGSPDPKGTKVILQLDNIRE